MRGRAAFLLMMAPMLALADDSSGQPTQTAQMLASLFQGCWACGAFNTVAAIGLSFADQAFSQVANGLTLLIGLVMALWILQFAATLFLPFGPPGAAHWNQGATKLFRLALVLAFLQSSGPFWDYVFTPLMSAGMGIASQMAAATDGFESNFGGSQSMPNSSPDYCSSAASSPPSGVSLSDSGSQALTAIEQMDCPMSKMQSQYAKGIMIGATLINQTSCPQNVNMVGLPGIQGLSYFFAGIVLILAFGFGYIVFPLLLIDVIMRVTLVAALSPLAIASTLFKSTERIANKAIWTLAQCSLTLIFGAAISGIGKATLAYIFSAINTGSSQQLSNWDALTAALETPCSSGLKVDLFSASFYMLVGTAIILIFMMRKAGSLATELTGVASDGVGAQAGMAMIAGQAAATAGRAAQLVQKRFGGGGGDKPRRVTGQDQS